MVSHSQARNIILGGKERTLTQVDIWDTFIQETNNYDDKRFERFYSHYCAKLVRKNGVKHKKDGHDLITMDQWISTLENKEDEELINFLVLRSYFWVNSQHSALCDESADVISGGSSYKHRSKTYGQRGWKWHPRRSFSRFG